MKATALSIMFAMISVVVLPGFAAAEDKSKSDLFGRFTPSKALPGLLSNQLAAEAKNTNSVKNTIVDVLDTTIDKRYQQQPRPTERDSVITQADSAPDNGRRDAAVGPCMASAKAFPKTGNSVVDTRCSLVVFEVCMNKAAGIISQSQGAMKQCIIIQGLGGPSACQQPCIAAAALPVGGKERVDIGATYSGLTPSAVACYNNVMDRVTGENPSRDACNMNIALQCLMNGSSSPKVNAAILRQRKSACQSFHNTYSAEGCVACSGENVRVDYDPKKMDLDPIHCTPELAALKQCVMCTADLAAAGKCGVKVP